MGDWGNTSDMRVSLTLLSGEKQDFSTVSQQNVTRDNTAGNVLMELTWYDSSPWADVFINNVFSKLPSSDGRKISLKDAFPLGGITWDRRETGEVIQDIPTKTMCSYTHTYTYSSVKERYVKLPAGRKHRQQCHRNVLAGVVYVYGFSSCQPQTPVKTERTAP